MELRRINLSTRLRRLSPTKFVIVMTLIILISSIIVGNIGNLFENSLGNMTNPIVNDMDFINTLFIGSIGAPLFETLIFQTFIIESLLFIKFFKKNKYLVVLISGLCFSLSHIFSYIYVIETFIIGSIFAYGYLICKNNNEAPIKSEFLKDYYPLYPFIMIAMVHSLYNTLVTVFHTLG